jgi:hypothetical protein
MKKINPTSISEIEDLEIRYIRKHWFIFTYSETADTKSLWYTLNIATKKEYKNVYINWKEYMAK